MRGMKLLFIFLILSPIVLQAQLTPEQTTAARSEQQERIEGIKKIKRAALEERPLERRPIPKTFVQKFDFHYAVLEGLDQNVLLDSNHFKQSFYTKQEAAVGYMDHFRNIFIYRLVYDLRHTKYYNFSAVNVLDQNFHVETALRLLPNLFLETGYRYRIFKRQHTASLILMETKLK